MRTKEWTDIPTDVVESIRKAVWFYRLIARNVVNDCYDDWWNREGLSLDLDNAADHLEMVLEEYGYPGRHELLLLNEPESEAEAVERKLLKKG